MIQHNFTHILRALLSFINIENLFLLTRYDM